MGMLPEQMEKMLKRFETTCICKDCPTYLALGEEDDYIVYCFPTRGKSKKIVDEAGCTCPSCPVYEEMKFKKDYYCTRGTEEQQKKK